MALRWLVAAALAALLVLAACEDDPLPPAPPAGLVQDLSLRDVNPNSFTHDQDVSPRQFVGQISAWYFGHAT